MIELIPASKVLVVIVAVQNAVPDAVPFVPLGLFVPLVGTQSAGASSVALPLENCTFPVGPAPVLAAVICAVSVTVPPGVTVVGVAATVVLVDAFVTVTASVLLVLV